MKNSEIREKILSLLLDKAGSYVSGERIAAEAGVSRAYIWKVVRSLQEEGYRIVSGHGMGYMLKPSDRLVRQSVEALLGPEWNVLLYDEIDSTNDELKRLAEKGAGEKTLVMARTQTAGRGRKGRSFYSPKDSGVYFSVLYKRDCPVSASDLVTPRAAVAVALAIKDVCGTDAGIKWVNDVYVGGRKVCGILTEAALSMESRLIRYIIVGIGINISTDDFPDDIKDKAGSLGGADMNAVVAKTARLLTELEDEKVLEQYRSLSCVLGKEVEIAGTGRTARAAGINDSGNLIVEYPDGETETLISGEISVKLK